MSRINLNGSWNAKCFLENGQTDFAFEGSVPGCVHTDLMGTKIPQNIYYRDNAEKCQWIEERDFEYSKTLGTATISNKHIIIFITIFFAPRSLSSITEGSTSIVKRENATLKNIYIAINEYTVFDILFTKSVSVVASPNKTEISNNE